MIYFDNAATTKLDPLVLNAILPYFDAIYGNPSAAYSLGRSAKHAVLKAKETIANCLTCSENEIVFTASGSESNNIAIQNLLAAQDRSRNIIITSKMEHPSVLNTIEQYEKKGYVIKYIPILKNGQIDIACLENELNENVALVSVMMVNNEVGSIQDIKRITCMAHNVGAFVHTDAVQAVGSVKFAFSELDVDSLSLSGHKLHAPKGIGAVIMKNTFQKIPFIYGGGQENNVRSGTENVPGIVGLSKAIELIQDGFVYHSNKLKQMKDYFIACIFNDFKNRIEINGDINCTCNHIINVHILNTKNTIVLTKLDMHGICVSAGAACSTGNILPSKTLNAMYGDDTIAQESIRISISKFNTKEDIDEFLRCLHKII